MTTNWTHLPYENEGKGTGFLTDVRVWRRVLSPREDRVAFRFRDNATPGVLLQRLEPPITQSGSGEVVKMRGDSFLLVRFFPSWIADFDVPAEHPDGYELTYKGPQRITPPRRWVRELVLTDAFEGYVGWTIGLRGNWNVNVRRSPGEVLLTFGR